LSDELVRDFVVCRLLHHACDVEFVRPGGADVILDLTSEAEKWCASILSPRKESLNG